MGKYFKYLLLAMVAVGLMAGQAFAATIGNSTGPATLPATTGTTVATELVGTTAGYSITDDGTIFYKATNAFVQNDVITFTLSNVTVKDAAFNLCVALSAVSQADYIGSVDATNGVSTLVFRVAAAGIPAGTEVIVVGGATCLNEAVYGTAIQKLSVKFPQLTGGATATVSAGAVFGTGTVIPGATAAATNLYTVQNQYAATTGWGLLTDNIDFDSDMKKILVGGVAATLDTGNVFTLADSAPIEAHALAATDKMDLTLSGSMSGVSRICFDDAACLAASTKKFTINTSTNTATYSVLFATLALNDFNGRAITFVVDGTTPLSERTFTVTGVMNLIGANELDRTLLSAAEYFRLALNAWQAIVPYVKVATGYEAYIRLNSSYVSTGTEANKVKASVLCGDGTVSVVDIGQITPGTSLMVKGSDIKTAAGATCVSDTVATNGFPVTLTVNAPTGNVTGLGTISQPEGLRPLPIKANTGGYAE